MYYPYPQYKLAKSSINQVKASEKGIKRSCTAKTGTKCTLYITSQVTILLTRVTGSSPLHQHRVRIPFPVCRINLIKTKTTRKIQRRLEKTKTIIILSYADEGHCYQFSMQLKNHKLNYFGLKKNKQFKVHGSREEPLNKWREAPQQTQRAEGPLRAAGEAKPNVSAISEGEARAYCTVGLVMFMSHFSLVPNSDQRRLLILESALTG